MKQSLSYAVALVIAFAGLASAQATTKPNPSTSPNAAARRTPASTLSSNPVMRVVRRVAAATGVGESEPEKASVPAPHRIANGQTARAATPAVSNVAAE